MAAGDRHEKSARALVAERRAKILELVNSGMTLLQTAEALDIRDGHGEYSTAMVAVDIDRALKTRLKELDFNLEKRIELSNIRLDAMRRLVMGVAARPHYLYQGGKPVVDQEGNAVRDDGPILAAIDRMVKIEDRWAKNNGLDQVRELKIQMDRRTELEATAVTEAILAGFDAIEMSAAERQRALEAAQVRLTTLDGEIVHETNDQEG